MAITQEREDIRLAIQLKEEGWIAEICNLDMKACQERATWCHETFGRMYDNMTWAGKWYVEFIRPHLANNKIVSNSRAVKELSRRILMISSPMWCQDNYHRNWLKN